MKEIKSQRNFFIDKEVKFNNSERKVVIAAYVSTDYIRVPNVDPYKKEYHLDIGYAIFNPSDDYNEELGRKIALGRAKKMNDRTISIKSNQPFSSKKQILSLMESAIIQLQDNFRSTAPFAIRRRRNNTNEQTIQSLK